jgi:hypothetical protein
MLSCERRSLYESRSGLLFVYLCSFHDVRAIFVVDGNLEEILGDGHAGVLRGKYFKLPVALGGILTRKCTEHMSIPSGTLP